MTSEWTPLFELFRDRQVGTVLHDAHSSRVQWRRRRPILALDASACIVLAADGTTREAVHFPWHRRTDHMVGIVRDADLFRICIDTLGPSVMRCTLEARCDEIDAALDRGEPLLAEVHLIGLLASTWTELTVLPHRTAERSPDAVTVEGDAHAPSAKGTTAACPILRQHQCATLAWMEQLEYVACSAPLCYEGHLRITGRWFVDTEEERFTRDPSWREANVRGGVVADWAGAGKTATVVRYCIAHPRSACDDIACSDDRGESDFVPRSRGTLVVVPINLVEQWAGNVLQFCPHARVVRMVHGRDVRCACLRDLVTADFVITTTAFLRASKTYQAACEEAVQARLPAVDRRHLRGRAALGIFARRAAPDDPAIVEAVQWHRLVVDEMHEAFGHVRDARVVQTLRADRCWGITATPELCDEAAQQHYWLLQRQKAHHPNLLDHVLRACVRLTRPVDATHGTHQLSPSLTPIEATDVPPVSVAPAATFSIQQVVCDAFASVLTDDCIACPPERVVAQARCAVTALRAEMAVRARDDEWPPLTRALADEERRLAHVTRAVTDLTSAPSRDDVEPCSICLEAPRGVLLDCAHSFCRPCFERHRASAPAEADATCPLCRHRVQTVRGVVVRAGTKLAHIADFCAMLDGPAVLFVQWKALMRDVKAVLRGRGVHTYGLEGNVLQRAKTLAEFGAHARGVLVLTLEESFAGLHLPHARHVVFSHAIVGDAEHVCNVEHQAIARCVRAGQTHRVCVHSFVLADSIEEDLWHQTHGRENGAEEGRVMMEVDSPTTRAAGAGD